MVPRGHSDRMHGQGRGRRAGRPRPARRPRAAPSTRARQSSPLTNTRPPLAHDAVLADELCGPTSTGWRRTDDRLATTKAQKPPIRSVNATTSGTEVWYGDRRVWNSVASPMPIAISPPTASAPWLATWASATRRPAPSRTSASPPHESGSTERPKSARRSEIAPSAPGRIDARVQDLESDPGDAGEEEQRDDVRVDQRREDPL